MSETLRITRAAGMTMLRRPKLALPMIAAAAAGYLSGVVGQVASQAMVQKWANSGGATQTGSALVQAHGFAALTRGQVLALEIVVRAAFEVVGSLCIAMALVATVRMMRKNGEVTGGIPWASALGLGVLWWLLGAAVSAIMIVTTMQLDGIVSADAIRVFSTVGGVVLSSAVLWVIAPRAVRLAATQGGELQENSERTGQRTGVLAAVLSALLLAINTILAQFTYARMDPGKARIVDFAAVLIGALPLVVMFIGFGMLTTRDAD